MTRKGLSVFEGRRKEGRTGGVLDADAVDRPVGQRLLGDGVLVKERLADAQNLRAVTVFRVVGLPENP